MTRSYVIAAAGILVATVLSALGFSDYAQRRRMQMAGGEARAEVTGGEVIRLWFVPLSHRLEVDYGPSVVFEVPGRFYLAAQQQGFVTVRYVPQNMLDAVIDGVGPYYPTLGWIAAMTTFRSAWFLVQGSR